MSDSAGKDCLLLGTHPEEINRWHSYIFLKVPETERKRFKVCISIQKANLVDRVSLENVLSCHKWFANFVNLDVYLLVN